MRLRRILFATALCAALATPAFPQLDLPGGRSCKRSGDGAITIAFDLSPIVRTEAVTDAPYSAVRSQQSVQTLADGAHLTRSGRMETATWRDSNGRVRTEIRVPPGERRPSPCDSSLVEIEDPVAGYVYLLDSVDRVAYRLPLTTLPRATKRTAAQKAASPPAQTSPDEAAPARESLGEKTMFGITVTGTRTVVTYPVGSRIGNDRPVTTTEEDWVSPELHVNLYSQRTNYDGSVSTTSLKDLSVAEPDPSLLQVPPGYRIIDESGSFTIQIPSQS